MPFSSLFKPHRGVDNQEADDSETSLAHHSNPESASNFEDVWKCPGCRRIERNLIRQWQRRRDQRLSEPESEPLECQILESFSKIEKYAERGCLTCRTIRSSLIQHQFTEAGVDKLVKEGGAVTAKLSPKGDPPGYEFILDISVESYKDGLKEEQKAISFLLSKNKDFDTDSLSTDPLHEEVLSQVRGWLEKCDTEHHDCHNLRWSQQNPSVLVEILSSERLRLIESEDLASVKYAALSYSWGEGAQMPDDQKHQMSQAKTRRRNHEHNKENYTQRSEGFKTTDLPPTMQDAVLLATKLDIKYIWIDQVCIGDAADWNHEASRMHEVYGNAYVTIYACATEKATDHLFAPRAAWKYPSRSCKLADFWLIEYDVSLTQVRIDAPVFTRAWVLQEERLSPRNLYWCSQRVYWSCSHSRLSEKKRIQQSDEKADLLERHVDRFLLPPQEFINLRRRGDRERIHNEWLDLVQDFTQRNIYDQHDVFPAMSGLAIQYLKAFTSQDRIDESQEYLAGHWRRSFAKDLTWMVKTAQLPTRKFINHAPRWSWASLPSSTLTDTRLNYERCRGFELLEPSRLDPNELVFETIKRGADVHCVRVKGRMRPFATERSMSVPWNYVAVEDDGGRAVTNERGKPKFNFGLVVDQNLHTQNLETGHVLVYEAHAKEVLGQLDYAEKIDDLRDLYCLEVGKSSMLLLIRDASSQNTYVRVGAAHRFRDNFFLHHNSVQELVLGCGHDCHHAASTLSQLGQGIRNLVPIP